LALSPDPPPSFLPELVELSQRAPQGVQRLSRLHHPDPETGSGPRFELLSYLYQRANHWWAKDEPGSADDDWVDDYRMPQKQG
jgi:hypothetical protein